MSRNLAIFLRFWWNRLLAAGVGQPFFLGLLAMHSQKAI